MVSATVYTPEDSGSIPHNALYYFSLSHRHNKTLTFLTKTFSWSEDRSPEILTATVNQSQRQDMTIQ